MPEYCFMWLASSSWTTRFFIARETEMRERDEEKMGGSILVDDFFLFFLMIFFLRANLSVVLLSSDWVIQRSFFIFKEVLYAWWSATF